MTLPDSAVPDCTVLIPTYNRRETLLRCLDHLSVQSCGAAGLQVIVVDDGSTDGTAEAATNRVWPFASFELISQANAGPAAARNRGLRLAQAPVTLFINDDALLLRDAVATHLAAHAAHPDSMVLGRFDFVPEFAATPLGRILTETPHLFCHSLLIDGDVLLADLAATCNLSVPTQPAQQTGFDEYFTFAAEDVDFAKRLEAGGVTLRFVESARALHDHHLTLDNLERMARLRGVGAARLAMKHGVPEAMLREVRAVRASAGDIEAALVASVDTLRRCLPETRASEPFPEACYGALADLFRLGNLIGYLDEPGLVSMAESEPLVSA